MVEEFLSFDGALTLRDAVSVQQRLHRSLAEHHDLAVHCEDATDVDLSFVQLLLAARISAKAAGGSVTLARRPIGALLDTLTRGGFVAVDDGADGFWFEGAER